MYPKYMSGEEKKRQSVAGCFHKKHFMYIMLSCSLFSCRRDDEMPYIDAIYEGLRAPLVKFIYNIVSASAPKQASFKSYLSGSFFQKNSESGDFVKAEQHQCHNEGCVKLCRVGCWIVEC